MCEDLGNDSFVGDNDKKNQTIPDCRQR